MWKTLAQLVGHWFFYHINMLFQKFAMYCHVHISTYIVQKVTLDTSQTTSKKPETHSKRSKKVLSLQVVTLLHMSTHRGTFCTVCYVLICTNVHIQMRPSVAPELDVASAQAMQGLWGITTGLASLNSVRQLFQTSWMTLELTLEPTLGMMNPVITTSGANTPHPLRRGTMCCMATTMASWMGGGAQPSIPLGPKLMDRVNG